MVEGRVCLGALGFGLCFGLLFGVGRLLCFGIVVLIVGRCFVFCGISGLKC